VPAAQEPAEGGSAVAEDLPALLAALSARVSQLEAQVAEQQPRDGLTLCVFSGDLDHLIAAFILGLGATAYDMEVDMFFTFWGIAALRDARKKAKKNLMGKMFGWMLPSGSSDLPLSQMNLAGAGKRMIRGLMRSRGVLSLEEMIAEAGTLGVRLHVCEMSMDLMGIQRAELIDYPQLDVCGVGSFLSLARDSRQTLFL